MEFLVLFLLGFSVAEGMIVAKCDLKDKVMEAISSLMDETEKHGRLPVEDLVAKIICHVEMESGFDTSVVKQMTPHSSTPSVVWTLYGLFQFSNHLVCSDDDDDTDLSGTICGMDCSKLKDDDIDDDIKCLRTIGEKLLKEGWANPKLMQMLKLIFNETCADKRAQEYFSDCQ